MEIEQLQEEAKIMHSKLGELRRNRNYYMQERDMFQSYFDIVHDEVGKTEAHIRNIESQMERMQDTHKNDIKIYLQKVVHLEYEHANNIDQISKEAQAEKDQETQKYTQKKAELKATKQRLKAELKKMEMQNEEEIRSAKEFEKKEMEKLKADFDKMYNELKKNYEQRLQALRDDLELRKRMETHEVEERKNRHINDLMHNHEQAFNEMRTYYNSITRDNLELIKSLNTQIEELKVKHAAAEKTMEEIHKKNTDMSKPIADAETELKELQHKLQNYDKDKISLRLSRARVQLLEDQLRSMQMEQKMLKDRYTAVERERDQLYKTFEETVMAVQKRSNYKNEVLEKMLDEYKDMFQQKRAQFTAVLRATKLDPVVLQNVTRKLDDVLTSKNEQIKELQYEIAKVTKAHNDLVRVMEGKMKTFGIPEDERNVKTLLGATSTVPADLIIS